jgi:hypothetical protein
MRPSQPADLFLIRHEFTAIYLCDPGISQRKRKRIEEVFGWMKTVGMLRKTRHRGTSKVEWVFTFAAAAYNLVRMRTLLSTAVQNA